MTERTAGLSHVNNNLIGSNVTMVTSLLIGSTKTQKWSRRISKNAVPRPSAEDQMWCQKTWWTATSFFFLPAAAAGKDFFVLFFCAQWSYRTRWLWETKLQPDVNLLRFRLKTMIINENGFGTFIATKNIFSLLALWVQPTAGSHRGTFSHDFGMEEVNNSCSGWARKKKLKILPFPIQLGLAIDRYYSYTHSTLLLSVYCCLHRRQQHVRQQQ